MFSPVYEAVLEVGFSLLKALSISRCCSLPYAFVLKSLLRAVGSRAFTPVAPGHLRLALLFRKLTCLLRSILIPNFVLTLLIILPRYAPSEKYSYSHFCSYSSYYFTKLAGTIMFAESRTMRRLFRFPYVPSRRRQTPLAEWRT